MQQLDRSKPFIQTIGKTPDNCAYQQNGIRYGEDDQAIDPKQVQAKSEQIAADAFAKAKESSRVADEAAETARQNAIDAGLDPDELAAKVADAKSENDKLIADGIAAGIAAAAPEVDPEAAQKAIDEAIAEGIKAGVAEADKVTGEALEIAETATKRAEEAESKLSGAGNPGDTPAVKEKPAKEAKAK